MSRRWSRGPVLRHVLVPYDAGATIEVSGNVELDGNRVVLALTARSGEAKVLTCARVVVRLRPDRVMGARTFEQHLRAVLDLPLDAPVARPRAEPVGGGRPAQRRTDYRLTESVSERRTVAVPPSPPAG